jgi:class 3 adenylate cyclase/tetratricopeptide (TPR) repeat protein
MDALSAWLEGLGLERYAPVFAENGVDLNSLPLLTDGDFERLGVLLGHRRRLLKAIADRPSTATDAPESRTSREAPGSAAERRQLTVMFCDLVGSTALSARLDPEELREIISAYHRCCAALIERAGGFVAKYMGDGVLAYFGYPRADEHDAERAVRAGLALVEAVAGLDSTAGEPMQVRVGIATGLVVVGDLLGQGAAQEQAVVGETPNLAARLQALAQPGEVVIAASTWRLTGGLFDYEDLGAVEIKGLPAPVGAARVLRESGAENRFDALRATTTPLVGRDEELALLERRWRQAKAGEGCVVLVSGEPGIGKSRLAQALSERLTGEPHTRLRFFCSPHHQDHALYPTITQLERAAGFRRDDTAGVRLVKLEGLLMQATNDLGDAARLIAALLSLPTGEHYLPLDLTPQEQKEKTLRALMAQVEGLALRQPVLMLFEDAHWSDPTSLELLELIIGRVPALPVLLIVTFRPEYAAPWTCRPRVTSLTLNRLAPRQRAEMIPGVTGGKALPKEITDQIVDRTDGVPLFVEELTKAVIESGMLTDMGDHYTATGPVPALSIPSSLHASLLARLDRLAPVREVAQIGAALGRQFSHELISAVASMPQPQLDNALAQLVRAELIYRRGAPPDAEYMFKHALVQDAAYSTLLRSRRQQLHARIAAILESGFSKVVAAQPSVLAHHCTEARLTQKAIEYWLAAGRQAWGRSATAEAVTLLQRGLTLIPALPDDDWRRQMELDLRIVLGRALIMNRGWSGPDQDEVYSRVRELASTLNRPRVLLFAMWGQFMDHWARADLRQAQRLAGELRELGDGANDILMRVLGRAAGGLACFHLGEFSAGRAYQEEALILYDPEDRFFYSELLSYDALVQLRAHSSWLLACLGHLDQALSRRDAALDEARRLSHPPTLAVALACAWLTGWFVRLEPRSLLQQADELLALATEHGLGFFRVRALTERGWCLAALGHADEGIPLLGSWGEPGPRVFSSSALARLGDACRMAGRWQAALEHLAEARRLAEETEDRCYQAETLRLHGDVLLATGDVAEAEASYSEALALAQHQSAKLWELLAAISIAQLWRDQGKGIAARDLLAPVYGWFTEGFGTPVLQEAKALLEELAR